MSSATQVWLFTWHMEMQHKSLWWFAAYKGDLIEHTFYNHKLHVGLLKMHKVLICRVES